jgi:hypothetical protein
MTGFKKENYKLSALQGTDFWASCWPFPATRAPLIYRCHRAVSSSERVGLEDQLETLLDHLEEKLDHLEEGLDHLEEKLDDLEERLDDLEVEAVEAK